MNLLLILLGVVLGIVLVGLLFWFWLRGKIKTFVESLANAIQGFQDGVPPFRISLSPLSAADWRQPQVIQESTTTLQSLGYQIIGDYEIPEMEQTYLRGFWHPQEQIYGVVYDQPQVGVFADLAQDLQSGLHLTVSCAPESGLTQPEFNRLIRLPLDLNSDPSSLQQLHGELQRARGQQNPIPITPETFVDRFTQAYAHEMDWRIRKGGVSAEEVRQVARVGGMEDPSEVEIQQVQLIWKAGIANFVEEQIREAFLRTTTLSAAEWETQRDRVRVIHEQLSSEELVEELVDRMVEGETWDEAAEERAYTQARQRLEPPFRAPSIRQGFMAAQMVLPEIQRYTLIGSVSEPFAGDLYLEPLDPEDRD